MACPNEDTLLALAEGSFAGDESETYSHVESCPSCRLFFNELARSYSPDDDETGAVGRYRLRELIGVGGMGRVYSAYDPELDRIVAIKLLRADVDSETANLRARLLREAQVMARLSHPNVVAVYDVGLHRNQVFIAMEMVDGRSLRRWVKEEKPHWRAVVAAYRQAGQALAAAHAVGIIHRDFKPDNALIDKQGRVRVLDFGLARLDSSNRNETNPDSVGHSSNASIASTLSLTRSGLFVGTPAYMAPEQHSGQLAGAAADQFSFCVALYEALWHERPFAGATVTELARAVSVGQFPVPNGRLPRWLYNVLVRGLRANPEDRYQSMDALLAALDRDPARVRRIWLIAAAMLGLVMLAAGTMIRSQAQSRMCRGATQKRVGVWDGERRAAMHKAFAATGKPFAEPVFNATAQILDDYQRAWEGMYTESCEATRTRGEQSEAVMELRMECLDRRRQEVRALVDLFVSADDKVAQRGPQAASSLPGLDECKNADALRQVLPPPRTREAHERVAALRTRLAEAHALYEAGQYANGLELAQSAVRDARQLGYAPLLAEALAVDGTLESVIGHDDAAIETLLQASEVAETCRHDHVLAEAMSRLSWLASGKARFAEAHSYVRLGRAALTRAGGDIKLELGLGHAEGNVLDDEGRYDEALAAYHKVLPRLEQQLGPDALSVARLLGDMGVSYDSKGDTDESIRYYQRSLAIEKKLFSDNHPLPALDWNNLGVALLKKDAHAALAAFEHSLAAYESTLGPDNPDTARALGNVGEALRHLGKLDRALAVIERANAINIRALGPEHLRVAMSEHELAEVLRKLGRNEAALVHAQRCLAIRERALGAEHQLTADALILEAACRIARGDRSQAIAPLERAIAILGQHPGDANFMPEAQFALAKALWAAGRERQRARSLIQAARQYEPLRPEVDAWLDTHH
jgi:tetratricopeptide (TPR) repeat protein/predicted Ser/Thr protein kinase